MRYKVIYENNRGQRVNLSERPYFLNIEPILDYQWSYSEKEKRRGNIIAGFAKDIQSVDLTLHIMDANADARDEAVDYFNNVIEADIYDGIAGRLIIGDWYTWGYIIASKNTKWQYGKPVVKKTIKLVREQENWYHVVQKANYGSEQAEELYNFIEEDIKTYEGADTNSLKSLTATINPKQSGSGDPSPDNVRPISGWDSVNVTRSGKNLLNLNTSVTVLTGSAVPSAVTISSGEGSATITENYYDRNNFKFGWAFSVKDNRTYTISGNCQSSAPVTVKVYSADGGVVYSANISASNSFSATFASGEHTTLYFYATITSWGQVINLDNIQLELGSTATAYEPYQADTYTTGLPETVYGGSLDVVNGVLTVDRAMVDLGTLNWTYSNSFFRTDGIVSAVKRPPNNQTKVIAISSAYPIMTWTAISGTDTAIAVDTMGRMIVANPSITSLSDFQTAISGVQLVYELAQPRTIQLTPKQVTTLLGTNNVWADSGDVTVEYWDDAGRIKTASGNVVTFSRHNTMSGAGYDYPYDYMADVQSQKRIENPNSVPCDFSITIQGYVDRPEVQIGDNVIAFDLEVPYGAFLTVDSSKKTAIMTLADGEQVNVFGARDPDYYLFERIKEGKNTVTWNGSFLWEIRMLEERSEPRWHMD